MSWALGWILVGLVVVATVQVATVVALWWHFGRLEERDARIRREFQDGIHFAREAVVQRVNLERTLSDHGDRIAQLERRVPAGP